MMTIARRDLLELASVTGFGAALAPLSGVAASEQKRGPHLGQELLFVGPYALGRLYREMPDKPDLGDWFDMGPGRSEAELVKFFDGCRLYVIDRRGAAGAKGRTFVEDKGWSPKVAIEGKLFQELKSKKYRELTVQIEEVAVMPGSEITDQTTSPPQRSVHVLLKLRLTGKTPNSILANTRSLDLGRCLVYDAAGARLQA
jgi:hypothetical protein